MALLASWTMGQKKSSAGMQMSLNWELSSIRWRVELPLRWVSTGCSNGLTRNSSSSTKANTESCSWNGITHATVQDGCSLARNQLCRKGCWIPVDDKFYMGQHCTGAALKANSILHFISNSAASRLKEDDHSLLLGTDEATSVIPNPVLCHRCARNIIDERQSPVEGHKRCWTLQSTKTGQGKRICSNWRRVKREQRGSKFLSSSTRRWIIEKTSQTVLRVAQ